ncbi:MAG TPA: hypothetical protein PKZ58_04000, partial [Bacillota bacterium]|nr:hypothetical protein [Bacillota bacterium]
MKILTKNRKATAILLSLVIVLSAVLCTSVILTSCDDNSDLTKDTTGAPGTSTPSTSTPAGTSDNTTDTTDTTSDIGT